MMNLIRPSVKQIKAAARAALPNHFVSEELSTNMMASVTLPTAYSLSSLSTNRHMRPRSKGGFSHTRPYHVRIKPLECQSSHTTAVAGVDGEFGQTVLRTGS